MSECSGGIAGYAAVLKVGGVEIAQAINVSLAFDANLVDTTTRASNGWRSMIATKKQFTLTGNQLYVADEAGMEILRDSALNGQCVSVSLEHETGGDGFTGFGLVSSFDKGEDQEDAQGFAFVIESVGQWEKIEDGVS